MIPAATVNDGNAGANYAVTFVNFTAGTINARALTVTASNDSKVYGGTKSYGPGSTAFTTGAERCRTVRRSDQ